MSVRPGKYFVNYFHLLPCILCISNNRIYYYIFHWLFITFGSKWLYHLYRHCFPVLFFYYAVFDIYRNNYAFFVQSSLPFLSTTYLNDLSSCIILLLHHLSSYADSFFFSFFICNKIIYFYYLLLLLITNLIFISKILKCYINYMNIFNRNIVYCSKKQISRKKY